MSKHSLSCLSLEAEDGKCCPVLIPGEPARPSSAVALIGHGRKACTPETDGPVLKSRCYPLQDMELSTRHLISWDSVPSNSNEEESLIYVTQSSKRKQNNCRYFKWGNSSRESVPQVVQEQGSGPGDGEVTLRPAVAGKLCQPFTPEGGGGCVSKPKTEDVALAVVRAAQKHPDPGGQQDHQKHFLKPRVGVKYSDSSFPPAFRQRQEDRGKGG